MHIIDLLSPERIACNSQATSKKRVLEQAGALLASGQKELSQGEIFNSLLARERLGSTGLGRGVALPHGRVEGCEQPGVALLKLEHTIDYDSLDGQPVDLVCALLVPQEATEEHLQLLSQMAEMFRDSQLLSDLRAAQTPTEMLDLLRHWQRSAA